MIHTSVEVHYTILVFYVESGSVTNRNHSWDFFLVYFVVPWRTRRSWRYVDIAQTDVWWWFSTETGHRFFPLCVVLVRCQYLQDLLTETSGKVYGRNAGLRRPCPWHAQGKAEQRSCHWPPPRRWLQLVIQSLSLESSRPATNINK